MKYYTVYKITNNITKKYYIGAHETSDLDDGYMGSGVYIKRAQAKYGLENFSKEILHVFSTQEEMFLKEEELVEVGAHTYNIMTGGNGGWSYARSKISAESRKKLSETMRSEEYREKTKEKRRRSSIRMKELSKDPEIRKKQTESLSKKMKDPKWKSTTGLIRASKISKTLSERFQNMDPEQDKDRREKIASFARNSIRVMVEGKKRKLLPEAIEELISSGVDVAYGWK